MRSRGQSVGCHLNNAKVERLVNTSFGHQAAARSRPRLSGRRWPAVAAARSHRKSPEKPMCSQRQRRRLGQQFSRHGLSLCAHVVDGISQVGRVPIDDGRDHQVEAGGTELLSVLSPVCDAALLEGADHLGQRMALLAFVQASLAKLPKLRRFQPIQHEQRALNAPQLLQRKIKLDFDADRPPVVSALPMAAQCRPSVKRQDAESRPSARG